MTFPIPEAALTQHIADLGKTGSGKSATARLIVERVVAQGFRACVLDTLKSDWWGITSSADGQRAGLPFKILGGPRGHVPLHSSAGKAIGQLVGAGNLPLSIIDMADFEPGGVQHFFVDFAQALWKSVRGVVYLVIEEAHEVAPKERAGFGAENMSIHWAKKIATGSRTKGIRLIVATQSVQQLHNRVLGSCETLIAHRLTTPADQDPVVDWLKGNAGKDGAAKVKAELASLPTGTAWVCSGEAKLFDRIAFPKFMTYDNTATPTSDAAEVDVKTAPVDQDELRAIIGTAVAEAEANDPKRLRAKIAELDRALAAKPKTAEPDEAAIARARDEGWKEGYDGALSVIKAHTEGLAGIRDQLSGMVGWLERLAREKADPPPNVTTAKASELRKPPSGVKQITDSAMSRPRPAGNGASLPGPQQRILDALAWWESIGITEPARPQVAVVASYSPKGGAFLNPLGMLHTEKLVSYPRPGSVTLTDAGRRHARPPEEAVTTEALHDKVLAILDGPRRRILGPLLRAYPDPMTREELATAADYEAKGGAFLNPLGALRSLGLIKYPRPGSVVALPVLFISD